MSGVEVSMKLTPKQAGKLYMKCCRLEEEVKRLRLNAGRYEFLRDEDNWGEDSGDDWGRLGEANGEEFDRLVDARWAAMDDGNEQGFDTATSA